jgi:drug/metabolite transporter (DMT)-like permease
VNNRTLFQLVEIINLHNCDQKSLINPRISNNKIFYQQRLKINLLDVSPEIFTMNKKNNLSFYGDNLAPLFVIVAASLWAVDGIVLRPVLFNLPVPLVVFVESLIATVLISPFMIKSFKSLAELRSKDWLSFFAVALFGGAIGTMAITRALFYVNYVNLSIVILIQKLQPVFALTLAAFFLREKLPFKFFTYAVIAIVGAYIMTFGLSLPSINENDKTILAAALALLAAISFGSSTVFSKRALQNVSFAMGTYLRFFLSTIIMLIFSLATQSISGIFEISSKQLLVFLLIAFTTGGTAIFLYYYGLKRITASVAAICELAFPLVAVILEYIVHGNILGPVQWIGVLLLLFSIIKVSKINTFSKSKSS